MMTAFTVVFFNKGAGFTMFFFFTGILSVLLVKLKSYWNLDGLLRDSENTQLKD